MAETKSKTAQQKGQNDDIITYLNEKAPIIDKIIEKWIPRIPTQKTLRDAFGEPRYAYNTETAAKSLTEPIWDLLDRGGKRWRPSLFLLTVEAFGGDPKRVNDLVLIPEVVHNGTLMIDDIEDGSDLRRGKPCTHLIFGVDVAVNAGNAMYYWPLVPLIKNTGNFPAEVRVKAFEIYSQELLNLGLGQGMDIAWHKGIANANDVTEAEYLQMCAFKTGTLARLSAKLAALFSGANAAQVEASGKFAEAIGVAFQIQDDILNIIESGVSDAKGLGEDVTEGKRTLLVIHTLNKASPQDRKRLLELLGMHTRDQSLRNEAIAIMKKYGAVEYCQKRAREIVEDAWSDVDRLVPDSDAKQKLYGFARFLIERKF